MASRARCPVPGSGHKAGVHFIITHHVLLKWGAEFGRVAAAGGRGAGPQRPPRMLALRRFLPRAPGTGLGSVTDAPSSRLLIGTSLWGSYIPIKVQKFKISLLKTL